MTKDQEQEIRKIARRARDEKQTASKRAYEVKIIKEDGSSHKTTIWAARQKEIIKNLKKEYNIGRGTGCVIREL